MQVLAATYIKQKAYELEQRDLKKLGWRLVAPKAYYKALAQEEYERAGEKHRKQSGAVGEEKQSKSQEERIRGVVRSHVLSAWRSYINNRVQAPWWYFEQEANTRNNTTTGARV